MARDYRTDYLEGGGRGSFRDPLTKQQISVNINRTTAVERNAYYAQNQFVQNIIDIPAEDLTRSWFDIVVDDEALKQKVMRKLRDLDAKGNFTDMRRYERLQGDGFIAIGVTQKGAEFTLKDPLIEEAVVSVDYLNAFSSMKVGSFMLNEDVFSNQYGKVNAFQLNRYTSAVNAGIIQPGDSFAPKPNDNIVDVSRLFHDQTRRLEGEHRGQSIIDPLWDILTAFDIAQWSVAQILYDFTFKFFKSDSVNAMTQKERAEYQMYADYQFRTEALAIIGNEDEIGKVDTNVSGIEQLLSFVWETLSGGARMPKSVIKGQEAGTITGAQYDVLNYYNRIAAAQETELRPHAEKLVRLIMREFGANPDKVEWELKFNPLWNVDQQTDATIRKLNAEADQIYIATGVLGADEVKTDRFPHLDPLGQSETSSKLDGLSQEQLEELVKSFGKRVGV